MLPPLLLVLLLGLVNLSRSLPTPSFPQTNPTVTVGYGTFQGSSSLGIDQFLGIPFAQAERFGLPQSPPNATGVQMATAFGHACPQEDVPTPTVPALGLNASEGVTTFNTSENCLFVNVIKPSNITAGSKLPVVFWIYGGGFEAGDTSTFFGKAVVARSIALGEPIIYVSANYRLSAFGFLASKEVKAAGVGNLGLRDQRFALKWVQDNIALFGGDPSKVTIWGQSAGGISVGLQMITNGGDPEGLFRGAFMMSGSPSPFPDISAGQPSYDQLVTDTNCTSSADTFACLKGVPFEALLSAINKNPLMREFRGLQVPWQPSVDGDFFVEKTQDSISRGAFAKIPMVSGDVDDEGTISSLPQLNITTDEEAIDFIHQNWFPPASNEEMDAIAKLYPSDPAQGSPFDTGMENQLSPQFKRLSAIQGDIVFQAPRRSFLQFASMRQDTWSYLYKRGKSTPFLGTTHATDIPEFYGLPNATAFQGTDAVVNFVNNLDPNVGAKGNLSTLIYWPKYCANVSAPPLLTFLDPDQLSITPDTYRADGMRALTNLSNQFL